MCLLYRLRFCCFLDTYIHTSIHPYTRIYPNHRQRPATHPHTHIQIMFAEIFQTNWGVRLTSRKSKILFRHSKQSVAALLSITLLSQSLGHTPPLSTQLSSPQWRVGLAAEWVSGRATGEYKRALPRQCSPAQRMWLAGWLAVWLAMEMYSTVIRLWQFDKYGSSLVARATIFLYSSYILCSILIFSKYY